jgi:hypothetical protein
MKFRLIVVGLAVTGLALLLSPPYSQPTYALASTNLEMEFQVTDAESGEAVPQASIELMTEDRKENGLGQQVIRLVTDAQGKARFVHENNSCEDVIRPRRKTVTLIDLTWASVNVSAAGYRPVERMWLHTARYENKGYFPEGRCQRVEFSVPLQKQAGKEHGAW